MAFPLASAALAILTSQLAQPAGVAGTRAERPPNLLLIVLDDVGIEWLGAYGVGSAPAPTPTLDALLARRGVLFEHAHVAPRCSPTRAELLTGLRAHRVGNGVGTIVNGNAPGLPPDTAPSLARDLRAQGYGTALLGKAHVTAVADGLDAPNRLGFDHFAGSLRNLRGGLYPDDDHYDWHEVVDGVESPVAVYSVTRVVDRAVAWIAAQGTRPWFAVVAFHAPHVPRQAPPAHLHTQSLPSAEPGPGDDPRPWHRAMVESVDAELGRLLAQVDLSLTVVVVVSDNGSDEEVLDPPFVPGTGKESVGEGGVHAPLFVVAPDAPPGGGRSCASAHAPDVTATLRDYARLPPVGASGNGADGRSLRPWVRAPGTPDDGAEQLAQRFEPNLEWPIVRSQRSLVRTVAGRRWKYVRRTDAVLPEEELWDLEADPWGTTPLDLGALSAPAATALAELRQRMDEVQLEL